MGDLEVARGNRQLGKASDWQTLSQNTLRTMGVVLDWARTIQLDNLSPETCLSAISLGRAVGESVPSKPGRTGFELVVDRM